jgi:hypothetical protein
MKRVASDQPAHTVFAKNYLHVSSCLVEERCRFQRALSPPDYEDLFPGKPGKVAFSRSVRTQIRWQGSKLLWDIREWSDASSGHDSSSLYFLAAVSD